MKRNRYVIILVFASGESIGRFYRGKTWKRRWKVTRKYPCLIYHLLGLWLTGKLINSMHRHVSPSDDTIAMSYNYFNVSFIPAHLIDKNIPNITGWVVVDGPNKPNLGQHEGLKTSRVYSTIMNLLMWATRGLIQTRNCSSLTRDIVRELGIDVPRRVWNPALLLLWLTENGYAFFTGPPPSQD